LLEEKKVSTQAIVRYTVQKRLVDVSTANVLRINAGNLLPT